MYVDKDTLTILLVFTDIYVTVAGINNSIVTVILDI